MLRKVFTKMIRNEWVIILESTTISSVTWIFGLGHADARRNKEADILTGQASIE
jgi:hypothetical protein